VSGRCGNPCQTAPARYRGEARRGSAPRVVILANAGVVAGAARRFRRHPKQARVLA